MDYKKIAEEILEYIGNEKNVKDMVHCMTRLRFTLYDTKKADKKAISKIEGVITVVESMGQFQVVIGNNVAKVYDEIIKLIPNLESKRVEKLEERRNLLNRILTTVAGIFTPTIPAIAGSGMIKGVLVVVAMYYMNTKGVNIKETQSYIILNALSDAIFYFLPIILGYTSAKVFKANEIISMVLGATLCYPALIELMTEEVSVTLFGLPITKASYTSSVIPIIIAIWILSYVEKFLKKYIPEVLKIIMVPTLSLIIMLPSTLLLFGPIGIYLGDGINFIYKYIYQLSPALCGAFIGGLWCILVIFGAHRALLPIGINDVAQTGRQNLLAFAGAANFSQAGSALGVFFKTRNKQLKTVSMSATITALFGITEPAIYGANLRLKKPMVCAVICGTIGGGIMGFGGAYGNAFANQGILTIPVYAEVGLTGFISYLIGCVIAFFGSAVLTYVIGFEDIIDEEKTINSAEEVISEDKNIIIHSPLYGEVISLSKVQDTVFSSGTIGKGVGIIPNMGEVFAPEDCTIVSLFPTFHALGLQLNNGVELLIHIGVNTVELQGKYFEKHVEQGETVKKGTKLVSFDIKKIKEAGYDVTVPVIISNSEDYSKIETISKDFVEPKDDLMMISV